MLDESGASIGAIVIGHSLLKLTTFCHVAHFIASLINMREIPATRRSFILRILHPPSNTFRATGEGSFECLPRKSDGEIQNTRSLPPRKTLVRRLDSEIAAVALLSAQAYHSCSPFTRSSLETIYRSRWEEEMGSARSLTLPEPDDDERGVGIR